MHSACISRRVSKEASETKMQAIVNAYPKGSPSNRAITLSTTLGFVLQMSALLTQSLALSEQIPNARPLWEPPLFHVCLGSSMDANAPKPQPNEAWTRFDDPELYDTLLAVVRTASKSASAVPARLRCSSLRKNQAASASAATSPCWRKRCCNA